MQVSMHVLIMTLAHVMRHHRLSGKTKSANIIVFAALLTSRRGSVSQFNVHQHSYTLQGQLSNRNISHCKVMGSIQSLVIPKTQNTPTPGSCLIYTQSLHTLCNKAIRYQEYKLANLRLLPAFTARLHSSVSQHCKLRCIYTPTLS